MVLKMPGQGIAVPWHRDRASTDDYPTEPPVFIADFYVDDADMDTCIWVVPGSHKWSDARTAEAISRSATGTASPPATPCRCRCLPARCCSTTCEHCEHCPSTRDYVIAKQKVLRACLRERRTTPYGADEARSTTGRRRHSTRARWPTARPPPPSATPPTNTRSLSARELLAPGTEPGRGRGHRGRLQLARPHALAHHGSVATPVCSRAACHATGGIHEN